MRKKPEDQNVKRTNKGTIEVTTSLGNGKVVKIILRQEEWDNIEEGKALVVEPDRQSKGKFKRSGHLTDQILKYNYPKDKQPSLFDVLKKGTLEDIEVAGVEIDEIVEGIKLSPSETKVIDSLCKLLHERSQTVDPSSEDYYAGNGGYELVEYGGIEKTSPKISLYSL
jgi:hypothetical protein